MTNNILDKAASWLAGLSIYGDDAAWVAYKKNMAQATENPVAPWAFYEVLRAYYNNSALYDQLRVILGNIVQDRYRDMHGLRNPANRITEFYVAHLWPGPLQRALPITVDDTSERLLEPIEQVWRWSNWGRKKQVASRLFAMLGDMFIKVVGDRELGRVWMEVLDPADVIDFDEDERGYLTYIRIDICRKRRLLDGKTEDYVYTEEWNKNTFRFRRWEHTHPVGVDIEQLGAPRDGDDMDMIADTGVDFVPFVHAPFRDMGAMRGVGSFVGVLDKIDEVNRKASRLSQQLFRHLDQTWLLESSNPGNAGDRARVPPSLADASAVQIGGERVLSIPAGWTLRSQIPTIDFAAMTSALQDDMSELQQDAPEIAYWRITENQGDLTGRAIRFMLGPAVKRAEEARGNGEEALVRAHMMALTIAQNLGLDGFSSSQIGTYENDDFWHEFEDREIIPTTPDEDAEAETSELTALTLKQIIGVPNTQLQREAGYTDEEIEEFKAEAGLDGLGNALLNNLESGNGQNEGGGGDGNPFEENPDDQPAE